jgi:uncharacterized membrane protein
MSLRRFGYFVFGMGLLTLALFSIDDQTFCKDCGALTWPIFALLFWLFGHWGTLVFVILLALWFLWIAFTEKNNNSYNDNDNRSK